MPKSWSYKLFLKINSRIGKQKWLDLMMIFCSKWLIFLMIPIAICTVYQIDKSIWKLDSEGAIPDLLVIFIVSFLIQLFIGLFISYAIGLIWRHKRPKIEMPDIKTLAAPLFNFKSFPSDHSFASFLIAFNTAYFMLLSDLKYSIIYSLFFIFFAVLVAFGRVYTGVHYPRDVLGGFLLALALFSFHFFNPLVLIF